MRRRHTRWALVTGVRRVLFRSGIGFVAFSPLGRGFLAGAGPVEPNDRRHQHPRFQPDAVAANSMRRAVVGRVAERLGATIAQVSLEIGRDDGWENVWKSVSIAVVCGLLNNKNNN